MHRLLSGLHHQRGGSSVPQAERGRGTCRGSYSLCSGNRHLHVGIVSVGRPEVPRRDPVPDLVVGDLAEPGVSPVYLVVGHFDPVRQLDGSVLVELHHQLLSLDAMLGVPVVGPVVVDSTPAVAADAWPMNLGEVEHLVLRGRLAGSLGPRGLGSLYGDPLAHRHGMD